MSEFECANGHMPAPSQIKGMRCPICNAPITKMDGYNSRQLREMEKYDGGEDRFEQAVEEDECDEDDCQRDRHGCCDCFEGDRYLSPDVD